MRTVFISLVVLGSALTFSGVAFAHHGWAAFASDTQVTLKGTVIEFHFVNPHSVIELQVKSAQGQPQVWECELTSRINLATRGWTAGSLRDREKITITGYPARSGAHALRVSKIVLSNGSELKPAGGN